MNDLIIWNLNSLPEFESIPPDEFKQILADYRSANFERWHIWLEIAIKMSFVAFGNLLYVFLKSPRTSSLLLWLITVLLFGIVGSFVQNQIQAHATRRALMEFIQKRKQEKDLELTASDRELYERLRLVSVNIAVRIRIPSNQVCEDRVLQEMVRLKPTSLGLLKNVPGATDEFVRQNGTRFIEEIRSFDEQNNKVTK